MFEIAAFDVICRVNVVFKNIFDLYFFLFFLSKMVDVKGRKSTFKVGDAKHILLNISEIIKDIVFVYVDEISVFQRQI